MTVMVGHRGEDAPGWPLFAPVGEHTSLQGIVTEGREIVSQKSVADLEHRYRGSDVPGSLDGDPRQLPGPKAHSWYITLHNAMWTSRQPIVVNGAGCGLGIS